MLRITKQPEEIAVVQRSVTLQIQGKYLKNYDL